MANDNLASIPDIWTREGLMVLTENAPALQYVSRQYDPAVARFGETVHAFRAGTRTIRRKSAGGTYDAADAVLTPVPVTLNQLFYDTIIINDDEMSKSIADLTQTHLVPVMQGMARAVNRTILGHAAHSFLQQGSPEKRAGKLGGMTKSNSGDYILEAQEVLHTNKAPAGLKTALVHQTAQTFLQGNTLFAAANQRGNANTLTTGSVGTIYNSLVEMSQDVNHVSDLYTDVVIAAVNNTGGYAVGHASAMTVTDPSTNYTAGEYVVLEENGQPTYLTATNGTTSITLNEPLKYAVTDTSVVTHYVKCTNEAVARDAGYDNAMKFTHSAGKNLQVGQLLSFGVGSRHTYSVIEVQATTSTTTTVLLDRPLDAAVASGADAFPGPAGGMNIFLSPQALAFVSRPLAVPGEGLGVMSHVEVFQGLGLRMTAGYLIGSGGLQINVDLLAGIKTLNADLGAVMLS